MTDELNHQPGENTTAIGDSRRNGRVLWTTALAKLRLPRQATGPLGSRSLSQTPLASFAEIFDQFKGSDYFSTQGSNPSTNNKYSAGGNIKHGNFTKNIFAPIRQ
jgi:hypothetical protein